MKKFRLATTVLCSAAALLLAACASTTKPGAVGVTRTQFLTVPAEEVDAAALTSFNQQNQKAKAAGRLVTAGPEYERLNRIAKRCRRRCRLFARTPPNGTGAWR